MAGLEVDSVTRAGPGLAEVVDGLESSRIPRLFRSLTE